MTLPKLVTPEYSMVVPSTGEKIKYRPFLVKEEKILLMALETEDQNQISDAVLNIVSECTFGKITGTDTPVFDMELAFIRIRGKSVGEKVTLNLLCPDDEKTRVPYELDLNDVDVHMTEDHTNIVELNDDISLVMNYPTVKDTYDVASDNESQTIKIFDMLKRCIVEIHDGEEVHNVIDVSKKELTVFFESMTQPMFEKLQKFFESMPKLRHAVEVKNPKTKKKNEIMLEGLGDFFV